MRHLEHVAKRLTMQELEGYCKGAHIAYLIDAGVENPSISDADCVKPWKDVYLEYVSHCVDCHEVE
jgi:hypothetical protein